MDTQPRNLVYACVFCNKDYILLTDVFLHSIKMYGALDKNTDLYILTSPCFKNDIQDIACKYDIDVHIYTISLDTIVQAKTARLMIFDLPFVSKYTKILYLDTDIVVINGFDKMFSHELDDKLYVVRECDIGSEYFGKQFFDFSKIDPNTPAFNSGVLLFNNCKVIKRLFKDILHHIMDYNKTNKFGSTVDQPFFNYHAITNNLQEMTLLSEYSTNDPSSYKCKPSIVTCHFAGNYNSVSAKAQQMKEFLLCTASSKL